MDEYRKPESIALYNKSLLRKTGLHSWGAPRADRRERSA